MIVLYCIVLYSVFGAGFHGLNDLTPKTAANVWKVYIVPRLLYGLEVPKSYPSEIEKIEVYQRRTQTQLQHLPPGASNSTTYLLRGVLPIQAEIEKQMLTAFVRLIRDPTTAEYNIKRQIVIKDLNSKSWTVNIRKLLHKFDLPSCHDLFEKYPPK